MLKTEMVQERSGGGDQNVRSLEHNIFCHLEKASEEGVLEPRSYNTCSKVSLTPRNTEKLISLKSKTQNAVEEDHDQF